MAGRGRDDLDRRRAAQGGPAHARRHAWPIETIGKPVVLSEPMGVPNLITFFGNRQGRGDREAILSITGV
jgi:hypothetical protein